LPIIKYKLYYILNPHKNKGSSGGHSIDEMRRLMGLAKDHLREKLNLTAKRLYTLKEAAQYLGRTDWSMRELIWAGTIPIVRTDSGRKIYLDKVDLDNFIDKNKTEYR